jgi:hypothetical protein
VTATVVVIAVGPIQFDAPTGPADPGPTAGSLAPTPASPTATPLSVAATAEVVAATAGEPGAYGPSATLLVSLPGASEQPGYAAFRVWSLASDAAFPPVGRTFSFVSAGDGAYELEGGDELPFDLGFSLFQTAADVEDFLTRGPSGKWIQFSRASMREEPGGTQQTGAGSGSFCTYSYTGAAPPSPRVAFLDRPASPAGEVVYALWEWADPSVFETQEPAADLSWGSFALAAAGTEADALVAALAQYEPDADGRAWADQPPGNSLPAPGDAAAALGGLRGGCELFASQDLSQLSPDELRAHLAELGWETEVSTTPATPEAPAGEWVEAACPADRSSPCAILVAEG